jgi:serine/threonine-protein kinase PknG
MTCVRAGCAGSYGPEGYCDQCGLKAPESAAPVSVAAAWSGAVVSTGSGTRSSRSSRRGQLGAGLIEMPRVPLRDPATVVMADPKVSESRRYCGNCEQPVGRGRNGKPGLDEGFCPHCRTRFSFLPKLKAGDLVDDRYELIGALAYGGLGWIYLARDKNIGDEVAERWVVLKGLINTSDVDAMAAAVTERRFLVEIDHPNIVKIYDFVQHPDPHTGKPVSYIVMEYVGGQSLRDLLLSRRGPDGRPEPIPLPQVLAYGLEVLPPLGYLHERGVLFCDFKPDNVIHAEEQLKLIDLGAVRRADDQLSAVYGTPGYQAAEVATVGPSIASDIYTVGRTLAVLSFDFKGFSSTYAERLPAQPDVPLLAAEESYHRLLVRATHPEPNRRFASAEEMREQLHGVLREVLSAVDGVPRPAPSTLFTPERRAFGVEAGRLDGPPVEGPPAVADILAALPLPVVDPADPGAGYLATIGVTDPKELLARLEAAPVQSPEVSLRLVRIYLEHGQAGQAQRELDALAADRPFDWRVDWYRGLVALLADVNPDAVKAFDAVYGAVPGEPAAQLGLAVAVDRAQDAETAATLYGRVWRTDRGFVSAAFGLARLLRAAGDRRAAVAVLDEVPDSSRYHTAAQVAAIRARLAASQMALLTEADLQDAALRLQRLGLDPEPRARVSVEILHKALQFVPAVQQPTPSRLLGHPLTERNLRFGLEGCYRTLAKVSHDRPTRAAFVDLANTIRPRTLI